MTMEDVAPVAEALHAQGQRVTAATVRSVLGTGSLTTLTTLVREWETTQAASQAQATAAVAPSPLPPQVAQVLERATQDIWAMACEVADQRLQGERDHHLQQLAEAMAAQTEAAAFSDTVVAQVEDLTARITELNDQLAAALQREEQGAVERAVVVQELAAAREALQGATTRVAGLEAHTADLNTELQRLHEAQRVEREQLAAEREMERQQHAAALERVTQAADDRVAIEHARAASLEFELRSARETHDAAVTEMRGQLELAVREGAQAQGAATDLRTQLAAQTQLLAQAMAHRPDGQGTQAADTPRAPTDTAKPAPAPKRPPTRKRPPKA
ncbi:nitrogen regulatory protein PII [Deinococcus metalli]|uniref:Nitrogen regulatory protein PII n=1 Tax=Deinococcus metalli TaxID=1141878 RepID=A0A7W8KIV0_9DEIO|nr:nitrogen regulatory protein PII [Deinococcus metalli]